MSQRRDPFRSIPYRTKQHPAPPDIYDSLRVAEPRRRNRHWEKEHTAARSSIAVWIPSWPCGSRKSPETSEVPEGEVARFLLEYALRAYAEGDLDLIPHPNPNRMRMTLFPVDEPPQRADLPYKPRKTKRKKSIGASWKVITTWRGFPPELKSEISDLASEAGLDVPVGELVTALLRFSLKAYEYGLLEAGTGAKSDRLPFGRKGQIMSFPQNRINIFRKKNNVGGRQNVPPTCCLRPAHVPACARRLR